MFIKTLFSILFFFMAGFLFQSPAFAEEKLVFALDIIRHGDRTPTHEIPKSAYEWEEGLGQLTSDGMQQEYKNGVAFRKMYVEQYHLLPPKYKYGTVYVRSTDFDRTLMSAESVLYGLYPLGTGALPEGYQTVPIHTMPQDRDSLLRPDYDQTRHDDLIQRYVYSDPAWIEKNKEYESKFKEWSDASGFSIKNLHEVLYLGDALKIRKLHNVPLPSGISDDEAEKIISLAEWVFAKSYESEMIGAVTSHELLTEVNKYLIASKQAGFIKYVLYSAHDSTILCVLSALQSPLDKYPPYASDLKFALFEDENNYMVKILFNDKPVNVPACGGSICSLKQFSDLVASIEAKAKKIQL